MRFTATLQGTRPLDRIDVGARAVGDLTCSANQSGRTTCRPASEASNIDGIDQGACVSLATGTWHAPGLSLHGAQADIRGHQRDPETGQEWAYVGPNQVVVPACLGRVPNPGEAEKIQAVTVGRVSPRRSPAAWRVSNGRVYAPGKWYHRRPGTIVSAYQANDGQFKGVDVVNVDLGGVVVCATICPHDSDAACACAGGC